MAEGKESISGLSCSICYNFYQITEEESVPRSLNCGHTYCTGCLEKLMSERNDAVIIRCPTCKRETVLLTPGLGCSNSLPKNFGLLEVLSIYENRDEKLTKSESTNSDNKPICKEHDEPMKVYCHTDKCLICIYCQVYGNHAGHDCQLACELVKAKKESVGNVYQKLRDCLKNLVLAKVCNGQTFTSIRRREDSLEETISEHFKYLHTELDKREECLKKRLHMKTREQAIAVLTQERVWSKLILKGHELRKRCGKVLRSTDYSILTENKSICDSMDELLELIASCELAPCPSYELTWVCENELTDAIKYHGLIVEENDSSHQCGVIPNDPHHQFFDEIMKNVERIFENHPAEQAEIGPDDVESSEGDEVEGQEGELDQQEEEEVTSATDRDPPYPLTEDDVIDELRSEMRLEIQRLKVISHSATVESQVLSDSSSETDDIQETEVEARQSNGNTHDASFPRFSSLRFGQQDHRSERQQHQQQQREHQQRQPQRLQLQQQLQKEQQQQQQQQQQQRQQRQQQLQQQQQHPHHYHHHHHHHCKHKSKMKYKNQSPPFSSFYNSELPDVAGRDACELCNTHAKWRRFNKHGKFFNNNHGHHSCSQSQHCLRSHKQGRSHSRSRDLQGVEDSSQHTSKCLGCPAVNDNNREMCDNCHDGAPLVATDKNICPMCTLMNEAGKSKCELCGFQLTM